MEAPPTPPVALGRLLADHELGLRHLAGPAEGEVHGVHASEMADPSPYLLGGELLLTAGAGLAGADREGGGTDAGEYVSRLVRAGTAALGFGVTPVHETVPRSLVEACARHGLPLVEVPPGTPFTAVGRSVWRLMARARTAELRRVTEAQQSLAAAAARPDPVPAVLRRLAAALGGWAGLLPTDPARPPGAAAPDPGPAPAAPAAPSGPSGPSGPSALPGPAPADPGVHAGPLPGPEVLAALAALARRVAPGSAATATAAHGELHLAAHALGDGRALALATPSRAPGDHTVASVAAVLLTLLTRRPAGAQAAALTRLLLGAAPGEAVGPGPWYAVHARGSGDPQALAAALGTVLLDPREDGVRLLTDRDPAPQPGWRLGVSAAAAPDALPGADAQAGRALERAEAARTPMARHTDPGFAGLVGEAEARAHAEALLGPLSPVLRDTLRAWLAHHGSWDRAAAALGVHRNTVRQRVARAAGLLGTDLDDPDTRMELWFALRRSAAPPEAPSG
ncbi:PucR family transcriptional regulator [Streptomyces sp. ICC4]|uniref:PucR family transcriptional regulator n=1 Tax=Streptomyces sp. ICC4 TaxID=2099584 RepID=UPI000DC7564C|nr:PucR family transcriptional regulator [Streptomyces sp. ICC4]AWZ03749.1 PucR family transcriptional regulator [Streptomyces sp. ICC4]